MPCDAVRLMTLDLKAADKRLLVDALKELGYKDARLVGEEVHFTAGYRTAVVADGQIQVQQGQESIVPTIRQAYSRQVVKAAANRFGWQVKQNSLVQFELIKRF